MRVLVATTAGAGHFAPLVPFAAAFRDAGHEVRVAAPESFAGAVTRAGFAHAPFPDAPADEMAAVFARLPEMSMEESNVVIVRDVFAGLDARVALPAMHAIAERWRPDVILRETAELASYVVAESSGIPHVQVAISFSSLEEFALPLVDEPLRQLGCGSGAKGLQRATRLSLYPPPLEPRKDAFSNSIYRYRYPASRSTQMLPAWWHDATAPLAYMTFGSVAAGIGLYPAFYRAALVAIAGVPAR